MGAMQKKVLNSYCHVLLIYLEFFLRISNFVSNAPAVIIRDFFYKLLCNVICILTKYTKLHYTETIWLNSECPLFMLIHQKPLPLWAELMGVSGFYCFLLLPVR